MTRAFLLFCLILAATSLTGCVVPARAYYAGGGGVEVDYSVPYSEGYVEVDYSAPRYRARRHRRRRDASRCGQARE